MHLVATRRIVVVALAVVASAALVATATGAHWPMFGGDAGHSGHQPVDPGFAPVGPRYSQSEPTEHNVVTSIVATAGEQLVYGTHTASAEARAHVQRLADGFPVGAQQGVDVDDGAADADAFTGDGGSVTPADTSGPGVAGVELFLHNDDNQDGGDAADPRTGGDIALAMIDPGSGQLIRDDTLGGEDPAGEETINMRVSSSPVLGPVAPGTPPARDLFFVAERQEAAVDPLDIPCNPDGNFDQTGPGPVPRGCNVPAERRLFRVTISDPGTINAQVVNVTSVAVASANLKASPAVVRLTDTSGETPVVRTYVAVGTDDGFLRTYDASTLATGPATDSLGGPVNTPVIPVRSDGAPAEADPPIYVTAGSGSFKAYEIRRLDPPPGPGQAKLGLMDATRDQSGTLSGTPGVAGAVSALADQMPAGGHFVVPASSNLYTFEVNDLRNADSLEPGGVSGGTTGFSRTVPALQGGLVYIARDNGEPLVLDEDELDPVQGFQPIPDPDNSRAANDGIGQPAISRGYIAFGQQDGLFVYRNENAPVVALTAPAPGATLTGTVTLRATAYNPRSGVSSVRFLLNGIEAGEGKLVSGSPTSSSNPGVYELSFDSRAFGNGQYQLTARAADGDTGPDAPAETGTSAGRNVTIVNETPTQLAVNDVEIAEGDEGTREATFTVTKAGPNATSVTVATENGSATAGSDYDAVRTELAFAAGDTSKTVTVPIRGDRADEDDETFAVVLSGPTNGAGLADASGLGIVRDDDTTPAGPGPNDPVVSVSSASIGEGPRGRTRRMTFDVSLSRPVGAPVTVSFATADQTAQAPGDYRSASGSLTFEPGQLTRTFTVTVVGDALVEGNEVFLVRLSDAAGAGLGNATGTGQIVDDEVARGARQRPSSVTLRLKPRRDRRSPFRFAATGNLIAPAGLSPLAACQGRVAVQVKAGRKTISTRRVRVRDNCTFRSTVTFRGRKRFPRSGRLTFRARFAGNGMLLARSSKRVTARTR